MIYLPNRFEIYLNNLRFYNSLSILKHGLLLRHSVNLQKIYLAEAYLHRNFAECVNLRLLSFNLLCCVKSAKSFDFEIYINENIIINKKLYIALLLTLAKNTHFLKIELKNGIIIKGKGEINNCRKIINYLNGHSFFDIKTNSFLIFIPCENTDLSPAPAVSQWELIFDNFSVFNIFFTQ